MSVSDLTSSDHAASAAWLGTSEMAGRVRVHDWSATPLGALPTWPQALRSAVAICLRSPFPMAVYWGPELICVYNDAEREVLGGLHPQALGLPARELLEDSWDVVRPQLEAVMDLGEATRADDQPLTFNRGSPEQSYFTYAFSPIPDDDGTVGGALLVAQDTTVRVLAGEQSDVVRELFGNASHELRTPLGLIIGQLELLV